MHCKHGFLLTSPSLENLGIIGTAQRKFVDTPWKGLMMALGISRREGSLLYSGVRYNNYDGAWVEEENVSLFTKGS